MRGKDFTHGEFALDSDIQTVAPTLARIGLGLALSLPRRDHSRLTPGEQP